MGSARQRVIGVALRALQIAQLHKLASGRRGAILTLHQVAVPVGDGFAPNQGLEVAPTFLDTLLRHLASRYRFVPLEDVPALLEGDADGKPFLAVTFDDGYRDTIDMALPILEGHRVPFTVFCTTGFLDRTARLWWIELELAIRQLSAVSFEGKVLHTRTPREKLRAFSQIVRQLWAGDDTTLLASVAAILAQTDLTSAEITATFCLDWDGLRALSRHHLARIGCHSVNHPRLSRCDVQTARTEMAASRIRLERELQMPITTFCYPYGGADAADAREFALAQGLGYRCAVTTRPGLLPARHGVAVTALPRVSINGFHQRVEAVDVLLSGVGFTLWNGLRPVRGFA